MWLSRLDLLAFGRFTDVRLPLGPALNLVYGPNEAGKSTTLRAIRQLLFGFDERTVDNFLHPNPNLRVGGIVCSDTGDATEVLRRKTRKDSLRAADDVALIDLNTWKKLICDVDESTFSRRYGIDYRQLVEGGHEIATGSGDLGEILFATGSGVKDLAAVQSRLEEEASELFRPQGKKQRLNLAIVEWQTQRDQVVAKLLPVSSWEEADRKRNQVREKLGKVTQDWGERTAESDRYRRWQLALPLVQEGDNLQRQLLALDSVPELPADFGTRRQQALILIDHAKGQQKAATESMQQAQSELDRLFIPTNLVARSDELLTLFADWGSCQKARLDRTALVEQCQQRTASVMKLTRTFGHSFEQIPLQGLSLDLAYRTRFGQLGRQQALLTQALRQAELRHTRCQSQIDDVGAALEGMPAHQSLDELQNIVNEVRNDGDLESQLLKVCGELSSLQEEADHQHSRLGLFSKSIDDLRSMKIPATDFIKQFEEEFDANHAEQSLLRTRLGELNGDHQRLTSQIEELRKSYQVPTESDLNQARRDRDAKWRAIRSEISPVSIPTESEFDLFEQGIKHSDRIADRLRTEADRVAQLMEHITELASTESRQYETSIRLASLEATRIAFEQRWQAEWSDLDAPVLTPREMQKWLARREILLANGEIVSRRRADANELMERIDRWVWLLSDALKLDPPVKSLSHPHAKQGSDRRFEIAHASEAATEGQEPAFQKLFRKSTSRKKTSAGSIIRVRQSIPRQQLSFGWEQDIQLDQLDRAVGDSRTGSSDDASLNNLLQKAEERLTQNNTVNKARTDAEETLVRLRIEQSETQEQLSLATKELGQWQVTWSAAMEELGLPTDTSSDFAASYVETLCELLDQQRQVEQLNERIRGIDADVQQFTVNVRSLCIDVAPDLTHLDSNDAVTALQSRLAQGQRDQIVWNDQTARKDQSERQLALAQESRSRAERIIAELVQAAGLAETSCANVFEELAIIEEKSNIRRRCAQQFDRVTTRLLELAEDEPIAEFQERVRCQSLDQLEVRLKELDGEIIRLAVDRDRLNQELGACELQLRQMDGGAEAAEAEEKQQQWLAQIRSDAEQYARLKLASVVLHSAIERYRDKTRGSVLTTASELFRELTLGSFAGLRVDEDDHHKPVLMGIRSSGREAVDVTKMSEGTCDQLYLALRLASLQLESAPRSRLPFIVDDILIQFDDSRAAAALSVLARLAQQRQVIFFTHHEHLLEVAEKHISGKFCTIRLEYPL